MVAIHVLQDHYSAHDLWFMVGVMGTTITTYAVMWAMCARWGRNSEPLQTTAALVWGVVRRLPGLRRDGRVGTDTT
jgi:hypothetical protein